MAALTGVYEEIRDEARHLDPLKVLLTVLAAIPFAMFWLAGKICRAVFYVIAWIWTAGIVGWRHAAQRIEAVLMADLALDDGEDHPKKAHVHRAPGGDPACSKHGMMVSDDGVTWSCAASRCRLTWEAAN